MVMEKEELSPVADFYRGRSVFITGSTGFMGKVLVEKLLRDCPGIERLFLLIRPKKGVEPKERLTQMVKSQLFDKLLAERPESIEKLRVVSGDITLPNLGICDEDREEIRKTVTVIFHSAATVKFDEDLTQAVQMNVEGTQLIVDLARELDHLDAMVHVSTAYANCHMLDEVIEEKIYEGPANYKGILEMCKHLDPEKLNESVVTASVIGNRPNTYTFTKALAESLLQDEYQRNPFPLAFVRPSIVTASWKDPMPGWIDNLNGPTGLIAGASSGIIRSMVVHREKVADFIPVDIPINLMCTVPWQMNRDPKLPPEIPVYNCTSGNINPIRWGELETLALKHVVDAPPELLLWYPGGSFKNSHVWDGICFFLFHILPAYLIDTVLRILGKKPFMIRVQQKVAKVVKVLLFFTTNQWLWSNDNMIQLRKGMSKRDQELFNFDLAQLDWDAYVRNYVFGTRQYVLQNDPKTIPSCKRKLKVMYVFHIAAHLLGFFLLGKFLTFVFYRLK